MSVSYKDLALLHLRDPSKQPFRALVDLLNNHDHLITWSTLQRVLRMHSLGVGVLQSFYEQGRLAQDKFEFGQAAWEFLQQGRRSQHTNGGYPGVHQNVYEVVWKYGPQPDLSIQTRSLYRGHWDSHWPQVSTLLREPLDVATLTDRLHKTQVFLDQLKSRHEEFFLAPPSDDELLAVAQHYGFPTPMLDYTTSFGVAAFFATRRAAELNEPRSTIGVIHRLRWRPQSETALSIADNPGIADFHVLDGAHIRIGQASYVQPQLADHDNRIARQEGLFVSGFQPRDLHGVALGSFFFWQEPDEVFEDPHNNVTATYLLPDDSPLALLAAEVSSSPEQNRPASLAAGLATTMLPGQGLIGSTGFNLQAAVTDARLFFKALAARVARVNWADAFGQTLSDTFDQYFQLCRIRSDLGHLPLAHSGLPTAGGAEESATIDPFGIALAQLAALSGWAASDLEAAVEAQVPVAERGFRQWPVGSTVRQARTEVERIALGCGVFLASWEVLQHVRGDAARDMATQASGILTPLQEFLASSSIGR